MGWDGSPFGVAVKAIARAVEPERAALIHGDTVVGWAEFDRLTDAVAAGLLARGLERGDVIGLQLRNCPEYSLAFIGAAKAGLIPVNVNYHYRGAELADIVTRFAIRAIVQNAEFAEMLASARAQGAAVEHVFQVGGDESFAALAETAGDFAPEDDPDARFYVATGGTTGMPKAVVWRQVDAWAAFQLSVWPGAPGERPAIATSLDDHVARAVAARPPSAVSRAPLLMLSPLMHGAGLFAALICLLKGGTLVTLPSARFDADLAIDTIARRGVVTASFVGDAFALPLADALERRADAAERIAPLRFIGSSGAVFSAEAKARLMAVNPDLTIYDALGSSESAGTAAVVTTKAGTSGGGGFAPLPGRTVKIFDAELNELPPGSEDFGVLARSGPLPLGYLGEDELNARTFPVVDGVRYLMTGDRARLTADGRIEFAGRDNLCINTGGEKVFPEEVEAVLQRHPAVRDARVIGLPDPRFGRRVAAVVQAEAADGLEAALDAHVRAALAAYKVPRLYVFTDRSLRLNNGKPDYKTAMAIAGGARDDMTLISSSPRT